MRAASSLIDLGIRAAESWRTATRVNRDDALQTYAALEVLSISPDAANGELWDYPKAVGVRIVLDSACREEAERRGHRREAPIAVTVAQACELQDYRTTLEQKLTAIEDWQAYLTCVRSHSAPCNRTGR